MYALQQPQALHPFHVTVTTERPHHAEAIEALVDLDFGPDRLRKTAYRLRDGVAPISDLGMVAVDGSRLLGTIRYWQVHVAGAPKTLLLGPIAIHPDHQGQGIGSTLMITSLDNAKALGWDAVILVGDEPYYRRFGFRRALAENLALPGPVDPARFLGLELTDGALQSASGMVKRAAH
ncbi:N-acetyltransferase [Magnetovibrio sp.]|uniref:GNAT family N-acetyltransferase n=1 Tax=Magnetovibrio sp. TaxID=2024836 RepID=UPI002F9343F9